jgi:subtilase family serine protease
VSLVFDIPYEVQWARTYIGVWGGTPRYTGWVGLEVNNGSVVKTDLFGKDDKSENVYVTGYGVYWVAYDTTAQVKTGHNTLVATTSRTDPNNKLDGRIYTVVTVVVVKDPRGDSTRYWIAEGNENLHGEGWSGTNPTIHNNASVTFPITDITGTSSADLSTLYLTGTKGQPDYIFFNKKDLGKPVTDTKNYPTGAYDIGDETSFNAGYRAPVDSRYADMEIFDVKNLIKSGNNEIIFERGRDLDGDGVITETGEKPEGEDYIHPVFAMLMLKKPLQVASGPDLVIGQITTKDAYTGEMASINATLQNLGTMPTSPATVLFTVDGIEVARQQVIVEKSGIQQVSAPWTASAGSHVVKVEVQVTGDPDTSNNRVQKDVVIGSLPDLAVSVDAPRSAAASATRPQKSPLSMATVVSAGVLTLGACGILHHRNDKDARKIVSLIFSLLIVSAGIPVFIPAATAADTTQYQVPVTIKNIGGSDATAFSVTIYLDGEKIATKSYDDGLATGKEVSSDIPVHTTPGSHTIKVVADEAAKVKDGNRGNNVAESTYVFP